MKRIIITVLGVLLVVATGMAGIAYWIGFQVETQYQAYLQRNATQWNLTPASTHYQRGWLVSDATTVLQTPKGERAGSDAEVTFSLRHRIYHGPLPVGGWLAQQDFSLDPAQAIVRTVLNGDAAWLERLQALYQGREPLAVISRIHLDGSSDHELSMPSLDITDQAMLSSLAFSGLQGQFHATPAGDVTRGDIDVAALRIVGRGTAAGKTVRLRNLKFSVIQQPDRFHFTIGNSILQLDELGLDNAGTTTDSILLGGITLFNKTTERDTSIDGDLQLAVQEVVVNDKILGKGQLNMSMTGLDGLLLMQIRQWSRDQMLDGTAAGGGRMDDLVPLFQGLLARHPTLNLEARVTTPEGTLELDADIVLREFSQIRLQDPGTLLQILARASAEISVSKTLLEPALRNFLKMRLRSAALAQQQDIDEPALERYAAAQVQQQLGQLAHSRFIEIREDRYKTRGRYADGRLVINGIRIPLWF